MVYAKHRSIFVLSGRYICFTNNPYAKRYILRMCVVLNNCLHKILYWLDALLETKLYSSFVSLSEQTPVSRRIPLEAFSLAIKRGEVPRVST